MHKDSPSSIMFVIALTNVKGITIRMKTFTEVGRGGITLKMKTFTEVGEDFLVLVWPNWSLMKKRLPEKQQL